MNLSDLGVPRRNGELVFDAPWQGRVFALADAVVEQAFGGDREPFRQELIKAIAAEPDRPYWESWTAALEALAPALPQRPVTLTPGPPRRASPRAGSASRRCGRVAGWRARRRHCTG